MKIYQREGKIIIDMQGDILFCSKNAVLVDRELNGKVEVINGVFQGNGKTKAYESRELDWFEKITPEELKEFNGDLMKKHFE